MNTHEIASDDNPGFATIAAGRLEYAEMAVDLALSLREHHDNPVCLVADDTCGQHVRRRYPGVFDLIADLPPRFDMRSTAMKFCLAEAVPYANAIFIDADTLVLSPLDKVIEQTLRHDFIMMGSFLLPDTNKKHHGYSVRMLIREFALEHYFTNHSGAFGYNRDYAASFLDDCIALYRNELYTLRNRMRGVVCDEIAFGIVAARRGMTQMSKPFPVMWGAELAEFDPGDIRKPLCHFHRPVSPAGLDWLMDEVKRRRLAQGLPAVSEKVWREQSGNHMRKAFYKLLGNVLPLAKR
ncbi:MAG: hypothetical protein KDJ55_00995 [Rhodobiaceae bacterium]|nr:hypothetical protein [Rhodobiaceae bacterium]MCC0014053.1 hypothetical protein [Rhodobiaceae bacterium]MCC0051017.1 hypothetical protein [Rhodobiaceae bacterium]MCC0060376.1 hypothetical protein [Rhodobiaceae bacterium]